MELLSFNRLCQTVGISQTTAENWIEEFTIYIPKTKQHDGMYYLPEAIDILRFIKKCKYQNYEQNKIMEMLGKRSFPIRVEDTIEDVKMAFDQEDYRDNILTVMQTIGATVSNVAAQKETVQLMQEQQEKQTEEIKQLKQEIKALKQQASTAKAYEIKKRTFTKLFE